MSLRILLAILAGCASAPAFAFDLPPHKPGLWEMTIRQGVGPATGLAMQRCTDASTDQFITTLLGGLASEACSKHDMRTSGDTIVIESTCSAAGTTSNARAEIIGSFESAYTLAVSTQDEGGASSGRERRFTVDAKWLGACEKGQKPGDLILPGGFKMNVRNIKGVLGLLGALQ